MHTYSSICCRATCSIETLVLLFTIYLEKYEKFLGLLTCMSVTCNSVITINYNSYVKCTWKFNWIMYLMGCLDWHIDKCINWFVGCYLIGTPPLHWSNICHRAVRVRALAGDIVWCSWATLSTLTVPLSTQVYKWVSANLMLGITLD